MGKQKLYWRTDYQIRATTLRVIGSDGKLIGVLTKEEALKKAKELGLTLVEIAANAVPPVAKIVDFGKFRYSEEKKLRTQSKGAKGGEVKEIRFSPFIAENDFKTRLARINEFLADKNKVRVVVVFKGPQMRVKHTGYEVLKRINDELGDRILVDMAPKFLGKQLVTVISGTTKKAVKTEKVEEKKEEIQNAENKE